MAVSPQSAALRSTPGYAPRPPTTAFTPPAYTMPTLPSVPTLADDARTPGYVGRQVIQQRLGQIPAVHQANLTNIRAGAQQALAGYGGYKFRDDNPATPEREDLILDFDAGMGLGEREKLAVRDVRNQSNAQGMLYSSFANQNIGAAVQRLSLEAQQIASTYAEAINTEIGRASGETANLVGEWAGLYGSDSAFLIDNPPPPPDPLAGLPKVADGSPLIWRGQDYPNLDSLRVRYPGLPLGVRRGGDGTYFVVIGAGAAQAPAPRPPARGGAGPGRPDPPRVGRRR